MPQSFESWLGGNLLETELYHEASGAYSYLTSVSPISAQTRPAVIAFRNNPDSISMNLVSNVMFAILSEGIWHAMLYPSFRSCPMLKLVGF